MNIKQRITLIYLLLSISLLVPSAFAQCDGDTDNCTRINHWQFSIALGAGTLSNPLHGGDNIPLIVIPYLHYYGEQFFIENNVIGYSFYQTEHLVISAVSQLNREKVFFTDWQPSHLFIPNFSESISNFPNDKTIDKNDIHQRRWALDAGLQVNWFISDSIDVKAQLLHDVNNVYHGFNGQVTVFKNVTLSNNTYAVFGVGLTWQSEKLADYYYGIDEKDQVDFSNFYHAESGFNPLVSLTINHKINQQWQVKFAYKQEFLGEHLTDSPLLEDQTITSAFVGVVYAF